MKKKLLISLCWLFVFIGVYCVWQNSVKAQNSNLNLVITITPQQYLSLSNFAFNSGTTISNLLVTTNTGIAVEIRQNLIRNRVENAISKFRNVLTDQQKDQVLDLIESF